MNISVLGCGRWGSFIAWYLNKIKHNVLIWGMKDCYEIKNLKQTRRNNLLFLDKKIIITDDIKQALEHSEIVVISISSQALRSFLSFNSNLKSFREKIIVLCMKGLEESTGKRLSEVVKEELNPLKSPVVWVGPGHVQDITRGVPTCMVLDSYDEEIKKNLAKAFNSEDIRIYLGTDIVGNEIGAASKNVIGIAAGILDGMGFSSLKGALMARSVAEISKLIKALGGKEECAWGLSHLGDYEATLFSPHSNNRKFGEMFVKEKKFDKLSEGVATTDAILRLSEEFSLSMPICEGVRKIIKEKKDPLEIIRELFSKKQKSEF